MFQSKHIIRLSFVGLFIAIVASMFYYRYFMIFNIIVDQATLANNRVTGLYKTLIWNKYPGIVSKIMHGEHEELFQDSDFIPFGTETYRFYDDDVFVQVKFYDSTGKTFFVKNNNIVSQDPFSVSTAMDPMIHYTDKYFTQGKKMGQDALKKALSGFPHTQIEQNAYILNKGDKKRGTFIRSYIPMYNGNSSYIAGVIEIVMDASDSWSSIKLLEKRVFTSFVAIFGMFFLVILYNTHNAQKIIDQQHKTNQVLEEAKERAETANTEKTEFLANVSHELRTPLNAIIGFSEMIQTESYGPIGNQQYKDYINDINNSGKHLLSVINDILDFSKAAADKLQVDEVELDLTKTCSSSMRFVKPRADSGNVRLSFEAPEEHIIITADPKRLKQALLNLLSNSVKFTPSDRSVTMKIIVDDKKKWIKVIVEDTGIGISEKDIPKALSSFGQVDNRHSRKYEGTGLGLPLTKKLVELMGAKFDLQSELGKGTTVTMTFKYPKEI